MPKCLKYQVRAYFVRQVILQKFKCISTSIYHTQDSSRHSSSCLYFILCLWKCIRQCFLKNIYWKSIAIGSQYYNERINKLTKQNKQAKLKKLGHELENMEHFFVQLHTVCWFVRLKRRSRLSLVGIGHHRICAKLLAKVYRKHFPIEATADGGRRTAPVCLVLPPVDFPQCR